VPLPHIVYQPNGEPVFSLTKYKNNDGKINGICYFDVELKIPDDARKAVQDAFPGYVFGQFDWTSAESFFSFDIAGELMEGCNPFHVRRKQGYLFGGNNFR
jgi:hypothetical protein